MAFVLVLGGIAALNATVDPAGLFTRRDRSEAAARRLLAGKAIPLNNVEDRRLEAAYAQLESAAPDVVIFGSSRVMALGSEIAPGLRVYNAATGSNTLNDTIALAGLFVGKSRPRAVLIGCDSWLLDKTPVNGRWRTLHAALAKMDKRLGIAVEPKTRTLSESWPALISLDYTLESLNWLAGNWREVLQGKAPLAKTANPADGVRRPDGSIVYPLAFRMRSAGEIRSAALVLGRKAVTDILQGGHLNPVAINRFERLIRFLRAESIQVILVLPPYHPVYYAYVQAHDAKKVMVRTDRTFREIARRTGALVAGSYDPARAGCGANAFWDGMHPKKPCLDRLVTPVIRRALSTAAEADWR